jgi:hypothetical protein
MCSELRNFVRFRDSTDSSPHFSDVWANAQRSRTAFIRSFISAAWQRFSDAEYDDRNRYYTPWSRYRGRQ